MRRRVGHAVLVITLLSIVGRGVAGAQAPATPVESITFDEALARALDKNLTVAQAAQGILRAEALLQQARVVYKPTAGANVQVTVLDSERGFDEFVTQPRTQGVFTGNVSYPILSASRWAAAVQAKDQVEIARLNVADVRRQVAASVGQAYLAIIAAQRQVEVDRIAIENAKAHVDYATTRLEAGGGSKLNELRASQELATDQGLLEVALFQLYQAQEALGALLIADKPIDASAEPSFEVPQPPADDNWLSQRTDIQLFSSQVSAADRVYRDSWKDWVPTASASWQPQWIHPSGLFVPSKTWQAVIAVDVPLFDGGERRAVKREREVARDTVQLQLDDLKVQSRSEMRTARAQVEAADRAVASARLASQHATDVVRITDIAFRAGATTNLELIDAQRTARDAATATAQAEDRARRARLDLLVAMGLFPK